MTIFATKEELHSIRLSNKDHWHFTNTCTLCRQSVPDHDIKAILIDRLSGIEPKPYTEHDYACHECLITCVGYFRNQM